MPFTSLLPPTDQASPAALRPSTPAWMWMLVLFGVLVVFDGALRKWVAPGLATILFVLKDGVLLTALGLYALNHRLQLPRPLQKTWLPVLLAAYGFWVLLEACNLNVPSLSVSVLGVKSHLLYMTLLILVPAAIFEMRHPLRFVERCVLVVVMPVLLLGIFQYYQPTSHWINRYVADVGHIAGILGHPRITGTFAYITGMTAFVRFTIGLGLGLLVAGLGRSKRLQWIGGGLLALALTTAPMTGSRSVLALPLLPLPIVLYQLAKRHRLRLRVLVGACLVGIAVIGLAQTRLAEGWQTFSYRANKASDAQERIESQLQGPLEEIEAAGLVGYGAGTAHQAAPRLVPAGTPSWLPPVGIEGETERLTVELGLVGLLLHVAFKAWMALLAYKVLDRAQDPFALAVGITSFMFIFVGLGLGGLVYRATGSALYWLSAGAAVAVWCRQRTTFKLRPPRRTHQPTAASDL